MRRLDRVCLFGALCICLLWAADVYQNHPALRTAYATSRVMATGTPVACNIRMVYPRPDTTVLIDVDDSQPLQPGYQRDLWFEFSAGCRGRRVAVTATLGERREYTIAHPGVDCLPDFTLIAEPTFQTALANRSHEGLRISMEYVDGGGP